MKPKDLYYIYCKLHPVNYENKDIHPIKFASYVGEQCGQYIFSETEEKRFSSYKLALEICEELNRTKPKVVLDGQDGWKVAEVCYPGSIHIGEDGNEAENADLEIMPYE